MSNNSVIVITLQPVFKKSVYLVVMRLYTFFTWFIYNMSKINKISCDFIDRGRVSRKQDESTACFSTTYSVSHVDTRLILVYILVNMSKHYHCQVLVIVL